MFKSPLRWVNFLFVSIYADQFRFSELLTKFQQNDFKMKLEHADVVSYDQNYYNQHSIKSFKYNRTCTAVNFTMENKIDFGHELEIVVQAYKFVSNEYRIFPLRFQANLCSALKQNVLGLKEVLVQAGNVEECPTRKGRVYKITNMVVDETKLPPFLPSGQFMWNMQQLYKNVEISVFQLFVTIYRPVKIPK